MHTCIRRIIRSLAFGAICQEAGYDAITVCALFNFYNKWVDVTDVGDMPPKAYAMSANAWPRGYVPQAQVEGAAQQR